jgi:hypothetical protein
MAIYGFLPFSFQWLYGHTFLKPKNQNFDHIQIFGVCWQGFKRNTSLGSFGCELFYAE